MRAWWQDEVSRTLGKSSQPSPEGGSSGESGVEEQLGASAKGDSASGKDQWGSALPGHGGT